MNLIREKWKGKADEWNYKLWGESNNIIEVAVWEHV